MDLRQQQHKASERYRRTADERADIRHRQEATGTRVVDTPAQLKARARRLLSGGEIAIEALTAALPEGESGSRSGVLERILGRTSELQSVNFLPRGERAARTVARITLQQGGRTVGFGTGFLVGPRLLMTNNHVLPDLATAAAAFAEFDCEADRDGAPKPFVRFDLDPDALFLTDEHLDMTLVALRPGSDGRRAGDEFGWNHLLAEQGKIVTGEPVNVIGHPEGRPKEIAIRENALLNQIDDFLHYGADTLPGNSGSPVFNDQWEVVALHHSGVPSTDAEGNWLTADGRRWRPQDGDAAIHWIANEGARVSVLLRHLAGLDLPAAQRTFLDDELGPRAVPIQAAPAVPARPSAVPAAARREAASRRGVAARGTPGGGPRHVVFLHGRQQQGKDPQVLRAAWAGGLARGLAAAGLPPVDAADVWFPFYGDVLAEALGSRERAATRALADDASLTTAEAYAPDTASARTVYEALIQEAAGRAGMPSAAHHVPQEGRFDNLVAGLQPYLSWLANRSWLDDIAIAATFRDVAAYLDQGRIRDTVLTAVLDTFPAAGEVVLISHSFGTVVALDLITRLPANFAVPLLVTAGGPLGMDAVHKRLLTGGPRKPDRVRDWVNAWCAADAVAIGCPLRPTWGAGVRDVLTENAKDRAHDIQEYLADPRVTRPIGDLLVS
jgi:endonuclease G, mitochondrial